MPTLELDEAAIGRLHELAEQADCTPNELIARWINARVANRQTAADSEALRHLQKNEIRLRALLDMQSAFVVRTDLVGNFTYVNPAWTKAFGWLEGTGVGASSLNSILPEDHPLVYDVVMRCLAEPGKSVQAVIRKLSADDSVLWTLWEFVAQPEADGTVSEIECIGFDITAQKQAEEALRLSNEYYQQVIRLVSDFVFMAHFEEDGTPIVDWADPPTQSGVLQTGKPYPLDRIHRDDLPLMLEALERVRQNQAASTTLRLLVGDKYNYWRLFHIPRWDQEQQRVTHVYHLMQDLTRLIPAEPANPTQDREYIANMKQLIAGVAHDVRVPLSAILLSRDLLSRYSDRMDAVHRNEKLDEIGVQVDYLRELFEDLSAFTANAPETLELRLRPHDLDALCRHIIADIQSLRSPVNGAPARRITFVNQGDIRQVKLDEVKVSRILQNLLSNAVKYSPADTEVRLEINRCDDQLIFKVIDQGMGIKVEDRMRIFDPFFRADTVRFLHGTGLGLSIVQNCVRLHNGSIDVESAPGLGATFTVKLPYVE